MNFQPDHFSTAQVEAFRFLQGVVQDLISSGKRRLGAFLKPELIRRSGGNFNAFQAGFLAGAGLGGAATGAGWARTAPTAITARKIDFTYWPSLVGFT